MSQQFSLQIINLLQVINHYESLKYYKSLITTSH